MSIITLTTDYGLKDHFVGAMKGKIYTEFKEAIIVDISHEIDPFNLSETSYIIQAAFSSFPKNTVHIIGVDLERNRETQHIAMQWNDQYFIAADNGILSILTQKKNPEKIVTIDIQNRLLPDASDMDVFITVACHLAKGGLLNVLGKEITAIKEVTELQPTISNDKKRIQGAIIYIDNYGNAVTNISKKLISETAQGRNYILNFKNKTIKFIFGHYSEIAKNETYPIKNYEGERLAIFNEAGLVEIALFKSNPEKTGSAHSLLGLNYRDSVIIEFI
ncbi:MAG: S-adenosylmethionine hydrolase [Flavobacterium sp.]|jgi:S-adenosylmethionine hydrolase